MTKPITSKDIDLAVEYIRQEMEHALHEVSSAFGVDWEDGDKGFFVCERCDNIARLGFSNTVFYYEKEIHACFDCWQQIVQDEPKRKSAVKKNNVTKR